MSAACDWLSERADTIPRWHSGLNLRYRRVGMIARTVVSPPINQSSSWGLLTLGLVDSSPALTVDDSDTEFKLDSDDPADSESYRDVTRHSTRDSLSPSGSGAVVLDAGFHGGAGCTTTTTSSHSRIQNHSYYC
jgi:hypothetical protein